MVNVGASDSVVERIIAKDKTQWYRMRNLRLIYLTLIPGCMSIESTSSFDSSFINGFQSLSYRNKYFGHPNGSILGILNASYSLGATSSLPFVGYVSDHVGRRGFINLGSICMVIGAVMQCFSVNGKIRASVR